MFDNLRQQASGGNAPFVDPAQDDSFSSTFSEEAEAPPVPRRRASAMSVMTPVQRFVLALMLFLNVAVLGCFCLLAAQKVVLPF